MKQTAVLLIGCYTVRNKKVLVLPRFAATGAFSLATWVVVRVLMRYALKSTKTPEAIITLFGRSKL